MSDPTAAPDPIDTAYVHAESLLTDEAARAERRARVLAAVAQDSAPVPARPPSWRPARWVAGLFAASLAIFFVVQVDIPGFNVAEPEPKTVPATPAAGATHTALQAEATRRDDAPQAVTELREESRAADAPVATPPPPPSAAAPLAFPLSPPPAPTDNVTLRNLGSGRTLGAPPPPPPPPPAPAPQRPLSPVPERNTSPAGVRDRDALDARGSPSVQDSARDFAESAAAAPPSQTFDPAASLRAAAAAGRTAEVESLLAQGLTIDAPDAAGNTALMLAIQARRASVAGLLRARGASLDRRNQAGFSAGDMARTLGDPELNRVLGLDP